MPGFDRSKLKSTSATALQKQQSEHEVKRPSNNFDRTILEIKPGYNKFRLFPFHPDSGIDTYSVPKTVSFLTVTKPKRDDKGKLIEGETEVKRSPVFNSKVHGNYPKDLVEEYMTVAKKIAIPNFTDDNKIAEKIWNIMTYAGQGSKAIKPSDTWAVYAMREEAKDQEGNSIWGKVGLLELKKSVTAQLTEKAIEFSGDTMTPDIYTDPDEGICIIINKTGQNKDTEYKVELDTTKYKDGNKMVSASIPTPLTDEQIDAWLKLDSLAKKFVGSFTRKDLEYQIEGLQNFDNFLSSQGYPINVFGYNEFTDTVEEMLNLVPEQTQSQEEKEDDGAGQESAEEEVTIAPPPKKVIVPTPKPKATVAAAPKQVVKPTAVKQQPPQETKVETVVKAPVQTPAPAADNGAKSRIDLIREKLNKSKAAG